MISQLWFWNSWHSGDVFSSKPFIQDLKRQLPQIEFYETNHNSPKLLLDLKLKPWNVDTFDNYTVQFSINEVSLAINTWAGAFSTIFAEDGHPYANWISLHRMWMQIYDMVEKQLDIKLVRNSDPMSYVATTDWSCYNISPAIDFIQNKKRIVLFCNGLVRANQSNIGLMEDVISSLAVSMPDVSFVCTARFTLNPNIKNIYFTDDIFAGTPNGDINEIAYLSTHAELIVGKNSGPYMYTHVQDNILRSNVSFLSLSHRPGESFAFNIENGIYCNYYHSVTEDSAKIYSIISGILTQNIKKMIVV